MPTTRRGPLLGSARRAVLALLAVVAIVVGGASAPAIAYDEGTIVSLANDARAANGLNGLVSNPSLDAVAFGWAQQLAANGTLSHNPSVGEQIPAGWTSWGENVAQGYTSGAAVHDGWMNSPGHRANILGDFTDIGVALIEGAGTTWAVQVFASYPGSGAAAPPQAAPPPAPEPEPETEMPVMPAPAVPEPVPTASPSPSAASPSPTATTPAATQTPVRTAPPATSSAEGAAANGDDAALAAARGEVPWWPWAVVLAVLALVALLLALPRVRRVLFGRHDAGTERP